MKKTWMKLAIYILAMVIAAILYAEIQFGEDIRGTNIFYFAYGLEKNQNIVVTIRWYFFICVFYSYFLGDYKSYISTNRLNRIVRYKNRKEYQKFILKNTFIKTFVCWIIMIAITIIMRGNINMSFSVQDFLVLILHFLTIFSLVILLMILDSKMNSISAFLIVNGSVILSLMVNNTIDSGIIKLLFFPNLLMGIQFEVSSLVVALLFISIINLVLILVYYKTTKNIDIL